MNLVIDAPSEKQKEFFLAKTRYVAYGGSRGGGKSWATRVKSTLLAMKHSGIKILIMRRTYPELRENHILPMCEMLNGFATYKDLDKSMTFPNGSRIVFGYCDAESDVLRYQGQEYDVIFLDEATQMTEFQFKTLTACIRGVNNFPKRFYLTCNPGGVGHAWVKRLFIDRDYNKEEDPSDYTFIAAKVTDNKVLMDKDPQYIKNLQSLPEDLRRAWLEGDWDALAGQYFSEFRRDRHVVEPFVIPSHWRKYVSLDYGLDMLACYWSAFDDHDNCYVYRELYQPKLIVSEACKKIIELTGGEDIYSYLAPSDLWGTSAETGRSQAEAFSNNGIFLTQVVARDRVDGWMDVHEYLNADKIKIFNTCSNLIRCFPLIQHDDHRPNDVATNPHELTHSLDSIRYLLSGRPCSAPIKKEKKSTLPWALQTEEREEGYHW